MINQLTANWKDSPEAHTRMNEIMTELTNHDQELREYRDWIEANIFGFGERSFIWLWKLLVDEMPKEFSFLEVGVFRGQVLALIELLAAREQKSAHRTGVTPLDETDGHWQSDYRKDIEHLHRSFNLNAPYKIIKGLSTDPDIIIAAAREYDLVYIDGGHQYDVVKSDLEHYPPMVKPGGYLVIDDCCNYLTLPVGMFPGIEPVARAEREWDKAGFTFLFSLVHIKVYQRA